ncbi:MAG: QueT transporter family protein [Actinomycetota bacterium]
MKRDNVSYLTRGAVIAALYVALTITPPLNAISYGQIQFRISEALNVLAFFEPAAIPGLFVGCMLANALGIPLGNSLGIIDVIFGSFLTLISAYLIWKIKKPLVALLAPVIINALGVALELNWVLGLPYWASVLFVGIGETVVIYALGYPLLAILLRGKALVREDIYQQKIGN